MGWLGNQLGFTELADWYGIRCEHFFNNKGRSLLMKFGSSPYKVVTSVSRADCDIRIVLTVQRYLNPILGKTTSFTGFLRIRAN